MEFFRRKYKQLLKLSLLLAILPVAFVFLFAANESELNDKAYYSARNEINDKEFFSMEDIDISDKFYYEITGMASYYSDRFHNRKTASGDIYYKDEFTAAHKTLPFGTILRVINQANDKAVLVKITDRGPYSGNRIIDLSFASAQKIDGLGLPNVKIEALLKHNFQAIKNSSDKFFFGYSYDQPLICIPHSTLSILDSSNDFSDCIRKYDSVLKENPDKVIYIFVPVELKENIESEKYIVATVDFRAWKLESLEYTTLIK
ncbi:MAG: rare lipoprotein [Ignavibacteria bacterium]|nr:rare lipoprotein [Ignavibacteria bacterium]